VTLDEAETAYQNDADYFTANDPAKTARFIQACHILLAFRQTSMSTDGRAHSFESIQKALDTAKAYYEAGGRSNGRSRVNRVDFLEPQGVD
jgi:hypothetical protein